MRYEYRVFRSGAMDAVGMWQDGYLFEEINEHATTTFKPDSQTSRGMLFAAQVLKGGEGVEEWRAGRLTREEAMKLREEILAADEDDGEDDGDDDGDDDDGDDFWEDDEEDIDVSEED